MDTPSKDLHVHENVKYDLLWKWASLRPCLSTMIYTKFYFYCPEFSTSSLLLCDLFSFEVICFIEELFALILSALSCMHWGLHHCEDMLLMYSPQLLISAICLFFWVDFDANHREDTLLVFFFRVNKGYPYVYVDVEVSFYDLGLAAFILQSIK